MLTITTPAVDLQLLSIEEMRELAGVTGAGQDDALNRLGLRIAADICAECNVAIGAGKTPTLKQETCTEIFRDVCTWTLILSRRHDVDIQSVTVDGEALASDDYEVDAESGLLARLCDDDRKQWRGRKITVVYKAGFETVPGDLAHAAADYFRLAWSESSRDLAVKAERVDVPDVEEHEITYWAGALPGTGEGPVPDIVSGQLARFRNVAFG